MSTVNTSSVEAMLSLVTERRDFYICIYFSMFCNRFYPQEIMKCHSKYNDCWQMIIIDKDMLQRKGFSAYMSTCLSIGCDSELWHWEPPRTISKGR